MEVILKKNVDKLGYANEIVTVKPGYGRNFLIPQGYAVLATASAKKAHAEVMKQKAHKDEPTCYFSCPFKLGPLLIWDPLWWSIDCRRSDGYTCWRP